ncbi:hypothetical protein SAMN05428977_101150 [Nitrosomonas sp. Nm166]|nr:hypothetical protein SAMN05428977_101150 [Nitrosomonas sp. Nm166]
MQNQNLAIKKADLDFKTKTAYFIIYKLLWDGLVQ